MTHLINQFSWSKSRDSLLRECPRRYYFNHYGAWGGWEATADPRTRAIYVLKQLKGRRMWAGEVVHTAISDTLTALRGGQPVEPRAVLDGLVDVMRTQWRASRDGRYRDDPKAGGLFEHEYGIAVSDWEAVRDHAVRCLAGFFESAWFAAVRQDPGRIVSVENLARFDFEGTAVNVKIDVALRNGSGVHIVDWKTGRPAAEQVDLQLACYALYAAQAWGLGAADITCVESNLAEGTDRTFRVDAARLAEARAYIRESIAGMKRLLRDPAANAAVEADFPLTDDERPCRWCPFRKVCPRFASASPEPVARA
jgi:hypothetical protein